MVKLKAGDLLVESKLEMKSEDVKWCIYFGKLCEGFSNGETKLPYYAAILFLLMQSIEMKTYIYTKNLTQMITAALIIIAKRWKQQNWHSTSDWINKI